MVAMLYEEEGREGSVGTQGEREREREVTMKRQAHKATALRTRLPHDVPQVTSDELRDVMTFPLPVSLD